MGVKRGEKKPEHDGDRTSDPRTFVLRINYHDAMITRRQLPSLDCVLLYTLVSFLAAAMMLQFSTARAAVDPGVDARSVQVLEPAVLHQLQRLGTQGSPGEPLPGTLLRAGSGLQSLMPVPLLAPEARSSVAMETRSLRTKLLSREAVGPRSVHLPRSALLSGGRNERMSVGAEIEGSEQATAPDGVVLFSYSL